MECSDDVAHPHGRESDADGLQGIVGCAEFGVGCEPRYEVFGRGAMKMREREEDGLSAKRAGLMREPENSGVRCVEKNEEIESPSGKGEGRASGSGCRSCGHKLSALN
jgi:hypothetical protein